MPVDSSYPSDYKFKLWERMLYKQAGQDFFFYPEARTFLKFGRNVNIQTTETTVMALPSGQTSETYVVDGTNPIDSISTNNAANNQTIYYEGHYFIEGTTDLKFTTGTKALNGTTNRIALDRGYARITRALVLGATRLVANSNVYFFENSALTGGVPNDGTKVHLILEAGTATEPINQSEKCATAIEYFKALAITHFKITVQKKQAADVDFRIRVREMGGLFLPKDEGAIDTTAQSSLIIPYDPPLFVLPNSDILIGATASVAGAEVTASFQAYIASTVQKIT